jgi:hypothetical protein
VKRNGVQSKSEILLNQIENPIEDADEDAEDAENYNLNCALEN